METITPTVDTNPDILNLDCPTNLEIEIQNWVGNINARIIENKISLNSTYDYIMGTITGSVKLYLNNLTEEEKQILKQNTDLENNPITESKEVLKKFEILIRREFGNLKKLELCSTCPDYLDKYICAFRINYYKVQNYQNQNEILRQLFFDKLPDPINTLVSNSYSLTPKSDSLGERISYLKTWHKNYCMNRENRKQVNKAMKKVDYCCDLYEPPKIGCKEERIKKYYKRKNKSYRKKKYKKVKPYKRQIGRKYFIKRKDYKKLPTNPKTCRCYNCNKIGHMSKDCKEKRNTNNKYNPYNNYIELEIIEYECPEPIDEIIKEIELIEELQEEENTTSGENESSDNYESSLND